MISRQQAAETLGVSAQTIDRLIDAGRLRALRLGKRRIGIPQASLATYVAECYLTAQTPTAKAA